MEGTVLHFDLGERKGLIRGSDNTRYSFDLSQWKSDGRPKKGTTVDFEIQGESATAIYSMTEESQAKSWLTLLLSDFKIYNKLGLFICAFYLFGLTTTRKYNEFVEFSLFENIWGKLAVLAISALFVSLLFGMKKNITYSIFPVLAVMTIAALSSVYGDLSDVQAIAGLFVEHNNALLKRLYNTAGGYVFWLIVLGLTLWKAKVADKFK